MIGLREGSATPIGEQIAAGRPTTDFYLGRTDSEVLRFSHRSVIGSSIHGGLFFQGQAIGIKLDRGVQQIIPGDLLTDLVEKIDEIRTPNKPVSIKIHGGSYLRGVTQELISLANLVGKPVQTEYNGVTLTISPEETVAEVFERYRAEQRKIRTASEEPQS